MNRRSFVHRLSRYTFTDRLFCFWEWLRTLPLSTKPHKHRVVEPVRHPPLGLWELDQRAIPGSVLEAFLSIPFIDFPLATTSSNSSEDSNAPIVLEPNASDSSGGRATTPGGSGFDSFSGDNSLSAYAIALSSDRLGNELAFNNSPSDDVLGSASAPATQVITMNGSLSALEGSAIHNSGGGSGAGGP